MLNQLGTYINGVRLQDGAVAVIDWIVNYGYAVVTEVHFVDGQTSLPVETFGRFNGAGVWVPVDPGKDGDTAWYGTWGRHLDMSVVNDPGRDVSGNNNHMRMVGGNARYYLDTPTKNTSFYNFNQRGYGNWYSGGANSAYDSFSVGSWGCGWAYQDAITSGARDLEDQGKFCWASYSYSQYGGAARSMMAYVTEYISGGNASSYPTANWIVNTNGSFSSAGLQNTPNIIRNPPAGGRNGDPGSQWLWFAWDIPKGFLWVVGGSSSNFPGWNGDPSTGTDPDFTNVFPDDNRVAQRMYYQGAQGGSWGANLRDEHLTNTESGIGAAWQPAGFKFINLSAAGATKGSNSNAFNRVTLDKGNNVISEARKTYGRALHIIKDRVASTGFQFYDTVSGGTSEVLNVPSGTIGNLNTPPASNDCVVWSFATPSNGINVDGGFSITNGNHGLNKLPEFAIDRQMNVYHQRLGTTQGLNLSSNSGATSQNWTVNESYIEGPAGANKIYAWTSVPGYSNFGQFQSSGGSNNINTMLGFRPKIMFIKSLSTGDWYIFDSSRDPWNPMNNILSFNNADVEQDINCELFFFANGFQSILTSPINNGGNFIYAAFAEQPAGGLDIAFSNAR